MNLQDQIEIFCITLAVIAVLDIIWLKVLMQRFYVSQLVGIAQVNQSTLVLHWQAILPVYLFLTLALHFFVMPNIHHDYATSFDLYIRPGLLGLVIYGIYQWTNRCLIPGWSLKLVVVDIMWGIAFFTMTTHIVKWFADVLEIY